MIKVVTLEYAVPHIIERERKTVVDGLTMRRKYFKTYLAENGNAVYSVDGELVTREEGNRIFTDIATKHKHKATVHKIFANDIQICEKLEKCIDPYYYYIDNTKDMEAVKKDNENVRNILNAFIEVAGCYFQNINIS